MGGYEKNGVNLQVESSKREWRQASVAMQSHCDTRGPWG